MRESFELRATVNCAATARQLRGNCAATARQLRNLRLVRNRELRVIASRG